jgi:hypothetical protein
MLDIVIVSESTWGSSMIEEDKTVVVCIPISQQVFVGVAV